jgi:hypothetical protein
MEDELNAAVVQRDNPGSAYTFAGEVTVRVEWYEAKVLRKTTATLQELSRVSIF